MKNLRLYFALLFVGLMSTGCQNVRKTLFPGSDEKAGTNPASVCRSPHTQYYRDAQYPSGQPASLTDNVVITTGEVNGEDGVLMSGRVCKRDGSGNLVGCESFSNSGTLPGGVIVLYEPNTVTIQLAVASGFARAELDVYYSCHGS